MDHQQQVRLTWTYLLSSGITLEYPQVVPKESIVWTLIKSDHLLWQWGWSDHKWWQLSIFEQSSKSRGARSTCVSVKQMNCQSQFLSRRPYLHLSHDFKVQFGQKQKYIDKGDSHHMRCFNGVHGRHRIGFVLSVFGVKISLNPTENNIPFMPKMGGFRLGMSSTMQTNAIPLSIWRLGKVTMYVETRRFF